MRTSWICSGRLRQEPRRTARPLVPSRSRTSPTFRSDRALADLVVTDPSEGLVRDLIYALLSIAPEGFRVREHKYENGRFWFASSENTLPEDLQARVRSLFAKMGEVGP